MSRAIGKIRKALQRFARARDGSAAAEFGLVAVPFFLLTFGLAEIAMIGFAQTSLDHAVAETARRIRTGQIQTQGLQQSDVRDSLCATINRLMSVSCDENTLYLDVDRFDSFVDAGFEANPIQNGQFNQAGIDFDPGTASDIVVVRAYYRWSIMTPMFENVFANVSGGQRILASTLMFRNEPFPEP